MQWAKQTQRGFTIVELLIVIVVIAILAAITIVAYNGIQSRTQNARTESTVAEYRKMLIAYATEQRSYPDTNSACLGEAADYPTDNCFGASVNPSFNSNLKQWLKVSRLPSPNTDCLTMYSGCRRAATFSRNSWPLDGAADHTYWLIYLLKDGAKCTLSGLSGGTWANPTSVPNVNGWTESNSGTSLCRVIMPDPATL